MSGAGHATAMHESPSNGAHDALNRMKRASDRGTGCHLTADMIASLYTTIIGEMWGTPDPRTTLNEGSGR